MRTYSITRHFSVGRVKAVVGVGAGLIAVVALADFLGVPITGETRSTVSASEQEAVLIVSSPESDDNEMRSTRETPEPNDGRESDTGEGADVNAPVLIVDEAGSEVPVVGGTPAEDAESEDVVVDEPAVDEPGDDDEPAVDQPGDDDEPEVDEPGDDDGDSGDHREGDETDQDEQARRRGRSADAPGQTGEAPGLAGTTPGQETHAPGRSGATPAGSEDAPGRQVSARP